MVDFGDAEASTGPQSTVLPDGAASEPTMRDDLITLVAIAVITSAGVGLFFRTPVYLTLGLVAGLTAGIGCTRWWRAAIVSALGILVGHVVASFVADPRWHTGLFWLAGALEAVALAAAIGAAVNFAIRESPRLKPLINAVAVLAVIATMAYSGLALASVQSAQGFKPIERLGTMPRLSTQTSDEDMYLNYLGRLRAGEPYYKAVVSVLEEANKARVTAPVTIASPLSYRLPTLYLLLAQMPSPGSLIDLVLLACSFGVVAAYVLARQFVTPVPALMGASLVASMFAGYTGMMLLDTETWAGILGLCAVTFVVLARRYERRALLMHAAAAGCALLAALIRELSVAFLLIGLAAALVDRSGTRRRSWLPWAVASLTTGVVYVAHWGAARSAFSGHASARTPPFPWFHPDGSGLVSAVHLFANHAWMLPWFGWIFVVLGMAGSVLAPKDLPSRLMLGGVALVGPLALALLHPPGWATYGVPGYWGDLFIPTTLACVPLAFAALSGVRREADAAAEGLASDTPTEGASVSG